MRNPYQPARAVLRDVIPETGNIKTFLVEGDEPLSFEAGQFVELTVPGLGEAPFTPSSEPGRAQQVAVTVMQAGRVTSALHAMQPGAVLGLRGPYGNRYPLERFDRRDILILGGGVGMAPLRSLLLGLLKERDRFGRIILCYGARTPADLLYRDQLKEWSAMEGLEVHLTVDRTDNGWDGKVGVVTSALDEVELDAGRAVSAVCGPPVMMKFGALALLRKGFAEDSLYLSMERNMSCGIGKCGHCRVGHSYVCRDGPVFTFAQLKDVQEMW
jgi:NAD(P)H-flavin reductase